MKDRWIALSFSSLLLASCAGGGLSSRRFVRPGLESLPAKSITVLGVVARPAPLRSARISVAPFEPPKADGNLHGGRAVDVSRSDLLAQAVARSLRARGFEVAMAPAEARGSSRTQLLESATTDQVLIARTVPLVELMALEEAAQSQVLDPTGDANALQIPTGEGGERPLPGEIHLAQLFVYDQKTGARLFSEQLPGVPSGGQLRAQGQLLNLGFTGEAVLTLDEAQVAKRSLDAAASVLLSEFPAARPGNEEARAALDALDVESERRREAFFDEGHLAVEVGTGWSFESIEGDSSFPSEGVNETGAPLPGLDTGAFAPQGAFHAAQLRVSWVAPGGWSVNGAFTYGLIPGEFRRRVFNDASDEGESDAVATQSIVGRQLLGGAAGVGRLFLLTDDVFLHPSGQLFFESWSFDVAPASTFSSSEHARLGLEARLDLWFTPGGGPLLVRAGVHGRGGVDFDGPAFAGGGGSVGVGFVF